MVIAAIAHSYWRSIKRNKRTYESIPEELKDDVLYLAKTDVVNGVITEAQFEQYIGIAYTPIEEE